MRWRFPQLAALGLALLLSGCFGGGATDEPIEEPVGTVEVEPGLVVSADAGVVRGTVIDDAGFPIRGARASLLGRDHFGDTGTDGGFEFVNVTAGAHELSVQAQSFQAFQREVVVTAANVTEVTVQMVPQAGAGAGYRPHVHDLWGERTEVVIMDADVDLREGHPRTTSGYNKPIYPVTRGVSGPNQNQTFDIPFAQTPGDDPAIVFPGTKEVRVTFRWDSDEVSLSDLGFGYEPADTSDITWLAPKASGEAWTIPVTQRMADSGHQQFSLWRFYAYAANQLTASDWEPGYILGPIHVEVVLVKGELYLEPIHEDFWQGQDSLVLRPLSEPYTVGICCNVRDAQAGIPFSEGMIVPPGTTQMRIDFLWSYDDAANGTPADQDYTLTWRTPAQNPHETFVTEFQSAEPVMGSKEEHRYVWILDIAPGETDAFYQSKTLWQFEPWRSAFPEDGPHVDRNMVTLNMQVTVYRDGGGA